MKLPIAASCGVYESIIKALKTSKLYAECPKCNENFNISKAILFDGTKDFPKETTEAQNILKQQLKDQEEELKKRKNQPQKAHRKRQKKQTFLASHIGQKKK